MGQAAQTFNTRAPGASSQDEIVVMGYPAVKATGTSPLPFAENTERLWTLNRHQTSVADKALSACFNSACQNGTLAEVKALIVKTQTMNTTDLLYTVQEYINHKISPIREAVDEFNDYRAALQRGAGDCDEYAIAKYDMLRLMGIPEKNMHIVLGLVPQEKGDNSQGIKIDGKYYSGHAVLAITDKQGASYILSNGTDNIYKAEQFSMIPLEAYSGKDRYVTQVNYPGDPLDQAYAHFNATSPKASNAALVPQ